MYKIIDNPERMSKEEIYEGFPNKWVFMVDIEGEEFGPWVSAVPVVVADKSYAGKETGLYEKLANEHDSYMSLSFLDNEMRVFGFAEVASADA
jgi:hypothetical protein